VRRPRRIRGKPADRVRLGRCRAAIGLIDLHCHILPALDDGALDAADAVAMARQAQADGILTVCATPHVRHDHSVVIDDIAGRVAELNAQLARAGVRTQVVPGAEVAETALADLDDDQLRAAALGGGGRWILLEPAPGPLGDSLDAAVATLRRRGFGSVIAHPERHAHADVAAHLGRLIELGALVQVTADMLEHEGAAPVIMSLARAGLVHLVGSDAHSSLAGRPVRLSGGLAALRAGGMPADHVDWIARSAPEAIVAGREVSPPFEATPR
jgi:protein-tyrosine phosphatase